MANCHDLFMSFCEKIRLTPTKKQNLKDSREAIRNKIRNHFAEIRRESSPKFEGQGSFMMGTIVNPLPGQEYDIDDGVYLSNLSTNMANWPQTEVVHQWIYDAVKEKTDEGTKDKRTCIRVYYTGQYHVDLPIYGILNTKPYLAEKGSAQWHISDARGITHWFNNEVSKKGEQLRRIVLCLKAWVAYKSTSGKLPSGLILTLLTTHFYESSDREDVSFVATTKKIFDQLSKGLIIYNPIDLNERVSDRLSAEEIANFKQRLFTLLSNANIALKDESKKKASKLWIQEFGDRFPEGDDPDKKENTPLKTPSPAILRNDGRSA